MTGVQRQNIKEQKEIKKEGEEGGDDCGCAELARRPAFGRLEINADTHTYTGRNIYNNINKTTRQEKNNGVRLSFEATHVIQTRKQTEKNLNFSFSSATLPVLLLG